MAAPERSLCFFVSNWSFTRESGAPRVENIIEHEKASESLQPRRDPPKQATSRIIWVEVFVVVVGNRGRVHGPIGKRANKPAHGGNGIVEALDAALILGPHLETTKKRLKARKRFKQTDRIFSIQKAEQRLKVATSLLICDRIAGELPKPTPKKKMDARAAGEFVTRAVGMQAKAERKHMELISFE